jgi:hypothetical protein
MEKQGEEKENFEEKEMSPSKSAKGKIKKLLSSIRNKGLWIS